MNCTFFGHRDAPSFIKPKLKEAILKLLDAGVEHFYVGNNGSFDLLVQVSLSEIAKEIPHIKYSIVLSYIDELAISENQEATIFPEGQELAYPKFAISKRNEWLLDNSYYVIAYAKNTCSNTHKIIERAKRKGLIVINLAEE